MLMTKGIGYLVNVSAVRSNRLRNCSQPTHSTPSRSLNRALMKTPLRLLELSGSGLKTLKRYPSKRFSPY